MAEKRTSKRTAARDRVREIRARLDAEKAERERRLYDVVTAFHEARVERDEALASASRHEATMAARLGDLLAMDEPFDRAATLCDLSGAEARGLRRRGFPTGGAPERSHHRAPTRTAGDELPR